MGVFFDTVRALTAEGKHVVLIGKTPVIKGYDRHCREKAMTFPFLQCRNTQVSPQKDVAEINDRLRRFAARTPNVSFYDVTSYICQNGICSAYEKNGLPRYYDEEHLSMPASSRLGQEIVTRESVPDAFRKIAHQSLHER